MATTTTKQRLFTQLLSTLPRHMDDRDSVATATEPRPVFEEVIYAICREGTTGSRADQAFQNLRDNFFDWNEIRVSSIREVADALEGLPQPETRAQRLILFLQQVFETTFSFDLEGLHKKGVKEAAKKLARYQAANDFIISWVVQHSLGGHAIPLDVPSLRVLRRLGALENELGDLESLRTGLEHQVPKAKGPCFVDAISSLADEHCWDAEPQCDQCPLTSACPSAGKCDTETTARPKPR